MAAWDSVETWQRQGAQEHPAVPSAPPTSLKEKGLCKVPDAGLLGTETTSLSYSDTSFTSRLVLFPTSLFQSQLSLFY